MTDQLIEILKNEKSILEQMLMLADEQLEALVKYDSNKLISIASEQEAVAKSLREIENRRIELLTNSLGIPRKEAGSLSLSEIEKKLSISIEDYSFSMLKERLKEIIQKLGGINAMNRVLANRGRHTVNNILSVISGGNNHVCNVKV